MRQVVGVGEVEVGGQVDRLKDFDEPALLRVVLTDAIVGDVHHGHILHFVDGVVAYQSYFTSFSDEDHVITLKWERGKDEGERRE